MPRRARTIVGCLLTLLLVGCGGNGAGPGPRADADARLVLDSAPNAIHAGIYLTLAREYDETEGVQLRAEPPSASTDGLELLLSNRADFAILDIHDLALAEQQGRDVVGVMAIVQTPLAAVLAQPSVRRPRDLEGRRVGVTGRRSDDAVLRSIVRGDGGDPARVRRTTIGSSAVPALLSGRVSGAAASWNVEGLALRARRPAAREFKVEDFGAPSYPELVLAVTRTTLEEDATLVQALVRALRNGYDRAIDDPEAAISAMADADSALRPAALRRQLDAVSASFTIGARRYGELDRGRLAQWAAWEQRFGVVRRRPDVDRLFDPSTSRTPDSG
jgi:ABC-type nitrate/sulfonate/bicarbonate transport system substrate-binding protein